MIGIILLLTPFISGIHGINWFQAHEYCSALNGSLPGSNSFLTGPHWTRFYKRKSYYLKIIGCYMSSSVEQNRMSNTIMDRPSAGLCQEFCLSLNYTFFAIQAKKCICLDNISLGNPRSANKCTFTCNDENDHKFAAECGGHDTYNVFGSDMNWNGMDCISIECDQSYHEYGSYECHESLLVFCQTKEISGSFRYHDWTDAMTKCKERHEYMFSTVTLNDSAQVCQDISNRYHGPSWLGVARQWYVSEKKGTESMQRSTDCEVCKPGGCSFCNCENADQVNIVCCEYENRGMDGCFTPTTIQIPETTTLVKTDTPSIHTDQTTDKTTQRSTEVSPIYTQTTPTESLKNVSSSRPSSKQDLGIVVAVPLSVVICAGVVIAVLVLLYKRRYKGNTTSKSTRSEKPDEKNLETNQYIYVDNSNNNYFVLDPGSHNSELDNTTKSESESPYNDLPEGEYDLLRDKDSRKKVLDDTYATSAKASDYSDYDVTNRNRQTEEDSTYDHAGSNISSVYGYGSVHHQEQDDNPYSKTEY